MREIVQAEVFDLCPFERILESRFHALPSARGTGLRRKNSVLTNDGGNPPQLAGKFDWHRDVPHFPPFSFALTAISASLYITSDHHRPKISAARIPVVMAMAASSQSGLLHSGRYRFPWTRSSMPSPSCGA